MKLYERIDELCRKHSVSVTTLCRDCSIARANLSDLKMGRLKSLSAVNLSKIASYFNVSINYLMGEDGESEERMLKAALFGGDGIVTDEMWNEVKRYAQYVKERENGN